MLMPGMPAKQRVIVYIDGFNLYFGIRADGLGRYLWLDLCAFSRGLLKEGQVLVGVKYFTSRVSSPPEKRARQAAYLDALGTLDPGLLSITYGNYQEAPFTCFHCGRVSISPSEKKTDVNIAVAMLSDAFRNTFDVALLVTGDSDLRAYSERCLRPAVEAVHSISDQKRVVVCSPPSRVSKELIAVAHGHYVIGRARLRDSQLPNPVDLRSGFQLRKPSLWDDPEYQKPH